MRPLRKGPNGPTIAGSSGNGGRFWLALQARYDLAVAERDSGPRIDREVEAA